MSRFGARSLTADDRAMKSRSVPLVSCSRLNGTLNRPARTLRARLTFTSAKTSRHGCVSFYFAFHLELDAIKEHALDPDALARQRQAVLEAQ